MVFVPEKEFLVTIEHHHPDNPKKTYFTRGKISAENMGDAEEKSKAWVGQKMAQRHCICFRDIRCVSKIEEMPEELRDIEDRLEDFEIISTR